MKAAIFDIDGTLLDSMGIWEKSADLYLESIGKKSHEDLHQKLLSATIETASDYLKKEYSIEKTLEEIQQGIFDVVKNYYFYDAQLKPGAFEYVKRLHEKKIPMLICSSGMKQLIEASMERLQMLKYFEGIVTGEKTTDGVFLKCLEILKTAPQETFVFEDGMHAIITAKRIGFKTVAVKDKQKNLDEIKSIADFYMEDFVEVKK